MASGLQIGAACSEFADACQYGPRCVSQAAAGKGLVALLEVFQTRIDDFFDPVQFRAPEVAHFIKTAIDIVKATVHVAKRWSMVVKRTSRCVRKSVSRALLIRIPTRRVTMVGTTAKTMVRSWVSLIRFIIIAPCRLGLRGCA